MAACDMRSRQLGAISHREWSFGLFLFCGFTLSNSYFTHKRLIYKQVPEWAMGSTDSPIVSNLFMEEMEKKSLSETATTPKAWQRDGDDICYIVKKNAVSAFHNE